ncbi:MAG TPA: type II toxin-antitoxin system VapC family toxin [Ilumatobacter sp.]|nr:type II toxin-antitoxin system VapC family toxin [Ilumatobacter sp.]
MIVDTSALVDAITDSGARGAAARAALSQPGDRLFAPGLLAVEVLSALRRLAADVSADFDLADIPSALLDAEQYGIEIEGTPWPDVHRAWELAQGSIRYSDGVFIAAAERTDRPLLTSDGRLARSRAPIHCDLIDLTAQ